ncbi:MAG: Tetratricopeptide 1 repeat-containing protein [Rhizobium sp.]|nr:Tetratricopeptide 1 repeat-containing protein [Rhizobium sp.]
MTSLLDQGLVHHDAGDLKRAEQCYRESLEKDGASADAFKLLALIAMETARPNEAIVEIQAAIDLQPEEAQYHHLLGRIRASQAQMAEAAEALRTASNLPGADRTLILGDLGLCLEQMQNWDEAGPVYAEILVSDPTNRTALYGKAGCAAALGDLQTAKAVYERLLVLDPSDSDASGSLVQIVQWIEDKVVP